MGGVGAVKVSLGHMGVRRLFSRGGQNFPGGPGGIRLKNV